MQRIPIFVAAVVAAWLLMSGPAAACYGSFNSGTFVDVESNGATQIRGIRGVNNLRYTPVVPVGEGHVHPAQLLSGSTSDFIAIGQSRGVGTNPGNCGSDYNAPWDVYVDGRANGIYYCETVVPNDASPVSSENFMLNRGTQCSPGWFQAFWDGDRELCEPGNFTGDWAVSVGLEVVGGGNPTTTARNIDVRYYNLEIKVGNNWWDYLWDFLPATRRSACTEHGYTYELVTDRQIKLFKPPYD